MTLAKAPLVELFTPLLAYLSILNTLQSYERQNGAASYVVRGEASVKKYGNIAFEDLFSGDQPSVGAAAYIVTNGGPNGATQLLMFEAYQTAFAYLNHGRSLAISTIILVIILAIALVELRLFRSEDETSA